MSRRIFFDLDGTLSELGTIIAIEEEYEEGFFEQAKPNRYVISGAQRYIDSHPECDYAVVSPILINNRYEIAEKRKWIETNIPEIGECIFYPCGDDLDDYIADGISADDVLIDDYIPNLLDWPGIAIRLLNDANDDPGWTGSEISMTDRAFDRTLEEIIEGMI